MRIFRLLVRVTCEHPVIGVQRVTVQEERAEFKANAFHLSFEAFCRQELPSVIGLAYVLSGSRSGAEDLAQEAFWLP